MLTGPEAEAVADRVTPAGEWSATDEGSSLLLTAEALAAAGGPQRLIRRCTVLRQLALPGVPRIVDLVAGADGVRLITDAPPAPTLADLLAGDLVLAPRTTAGLLDDLGRTLQALRSARLRETALALAAVVFGADGRALLREAAVRTASDGTGAWAEVVTAVGQRWGGEHAASFAAVAAAARDEGLDAGLAALSELAARLPDDPERADLRRAVEGWELPPGRARATMLGRRAGGGRPGSQPAAPAPDRG